MDVPTIIFDKSQYSKQHNEIYIDLNKNIPLKTIIESSNPRIITVQSPSGTTEQFRFIANDGWEKVYQGKHCDLRLGLDQRFQ